MTLSKDREEEIRTWHETDPYGSIHEVFAELDESRTKIEYLLKEREAMLKIQTEMRDSLNANWIGNHKENKVLRSVCFELAVVLIKISKNTGKTSRTDQSLAREVLEDTERMLENAGIK